MALLNHEILKFGVTNFSRNPNGPVELGNPNICAEVKLCVLFINTPAPFSGERILGVASLSFINKNWALTKI